MFKPIYIYIKLKADQIEATDLEGGRTISKRALKPFSSIRNIVSNFNNANETIESVLLDLGLRRFFFNPD